MRGRVAREYPDLPPRDFYKNYLFAVFLFGFVPRDQFFALVIAHGHSMLLVARRAFGGRGDNLSQTEGENVRYRLRHRDRSLAGSPTYFNMTQHTI